VQVSDAAASRRTVEELRGAGVELALDDVAAEDGLLCLESFFGVNLVKLDRCVVRHLRNPRRRAVYGALVAMARAGGLGTVLEGVETADDLEAARRLGVDLVQGFLFRGASVTVRS
jgi:EAL domain-containing protein (putative c-di-GMP-specific phosphodiesterase class I)